MGICFTIEDSLGSFLAKITHFNGSGRVQLGGTGQAASRVDLPSSLTFGTNMAYFAHPYLR
jgi:hypothetical protein